MHRELIEKWNSRVKANDTVFVLGDFAWTTKVAAEVRPHLSGHIRLVTGNHDANDSAYGDGIFQKVHYWYQFPWCGLTAHHIPLHPAMIRGGKAQVHGHIHNNENDIAALGPQYLNVSCEVLDYFPLSAVRVYEWAESVNKLPRSKLCLK
jgi:calcineurin-like phosphoesterase family protein